MVGGQSWLYEICQKAKRTRQRPVHSHGLYTWVLAVTHGSNGRVAWYASVILNSRTSESCGEGCMSPRNSSRSSEAS